MQEDSPLNQGQNAFKDLFNLHPRDALAFAVDINHHLRLFSNSFKDRIQVELDYSRALYKISKNLHSYINPQRPTPLSYLSSAFEVQHEQRARHALQLAQYLHSEIEIPCQNLLQDMQVLIKQLQKQFKKQYKQAEVVEENYQKHLKKYVRGKEQWEQKLMNTLILGFLPGLSQKQLQKSRMKLEDEKRQNNVIQNRYMTSLQMFNNFADQYNQFIQTPLNQLAAQCIKNLALQSDSLRKLIVSEVNMFKNIEYDLLNISRQMQQLRPGLQIDSFNKQQAFNFNLPILSIYSDGPLSQNKSQIDLKYPIENSFFSQTLQKIENSSFIWMLDNKHNSTFRYCLKQAWKKFQGLQSQDFMKDLQECIVTNKVVLNIRIDGSNEKLSLDEVFDVTFSIICLIGSFVRDIKLEQQKQKETVNNIRKYLKIHHFYRFIVFLSLQQFNELRENKILSKMQRFHLILVFKILIQESYLSKDTFVLRLTICLLFQNIQFPPFFMEPMIRQLDFWNSLQMWQSILFEGTYEEVSLLPSMVKSQLKQIYLMRQKNVIFSALTTYCHTMVMMGCDLLQVKKVVLRFCHTYSLYDEHQKDLLKMIKNSYSSLQKEIQRFQQQEQQVVPGAVEEAKLEQNIKQKTNQSYSQNDSKQ